MLTWHTTHGSVAWCYNEDQTDQYWTEVRQACEHGAMCVFAWMLIGTIRIHCVFALNSTLTWFLLSSLAVKHTATSWFIVNHRFLFNSCTFLHLLPPACRKMWSLAPSYRDTSDSVQATRQRADLRHTLAAVILVFLRVEQSWHLKYNTTESSVIYLYHTWQVYKIQQKTRLCWKDQKKNP